MLLVYRLVYIWKVKLHERAGMLVRGKKKMDMDWLCKRNVIDIHHKGGHAQKKWRGRTKDMWRRSMELESNAIGWSWEPDRKTGSGQTTMASTWIEYVS